MFVNNDEKYERLVRELRHKPLLPNGTREIFNYRDTFNVHHPISMAKQTYIENELAWYLSEDLNINEHKGIERNKVWSKVASPTGFVNSNYGWCIFSDENYKQYSHALMALLRDPWTRQSCCIYTRPSIQEHHNDGSHANADFICTYATQHFIRNGRLEYIVFMRSNDVRYGLPYDLAWHQYVYKKLFNDLIAAGERTENDVYKHLQVGRIHWHAASMHMYESNT